MLRTFVFGPNFVFRTNFVFSAPQTECRLHNCCLQGRFSSSNFVFAHNLSFSSWRNNFVFESFGISASGENETGTQFPGSMYICHHPLRYLGFRLYADALLKWADGKGIGKHESALFESTRSCLHLRVKPTISVIGSRKINVGKTNNSNNFHEYREIS